MKIFDLLRRATEARRLRGNNPPRPTGGRHSTNPDKWRAAWADQPTGPMSRAELSSLLDDAPWGGGLR